ncbi:MAG: C-GCAxxG-C-C family protein [Cellulosilyticaceae bacterium]
MTKQEKAIAYHLEGYNCSQAVVGVFCEELGMTKEEAMKVASGFGGGMRCAQTCGAVTGALMALGLKYGQVHGEDQETKMAMYQKVTAFHEQFKAQNQTVVCKELLGHDITTEEGMAQIKEKGLSRTVCDQLIADAVAIVEDMLV